MPKGQVDEPPVAGGEVLQRGQIGGELLEGLFSVPRRCAIETGGDPLPSAQFMAAHAMAYRK